MSRQIPDHIGEFVIEGLLGEGGMGVVYLARDPLGRRVALKLIREELSTSDELARRFRRESHIALTLRHPNIVRTYDAGILDGQLFMSCEFIEGGTLADLLDRQGALDEACTLGIARDVIAALAAIDTAGLIHRDVKPLNVLVGSDGHVRLADLGLARSTSNSRSLYTATGMILGTPAYASPEQLQGDDALDIRSDIYSTGIMLFRCLTGALPYDGREIIDVVHQHCFGPVKDPRSVRRDAAADLCGFIMDLMCKDRGQRLGDPARALERIESMIEERGLKESALSLKPCVAEKSTGHSNGGASLTSMPTMLITQVRTGREGKAPKAERTATLARDMIRAAASASEAPAQASLRIRSGETSYVLIAHASDRLGFGRLRNDAHAAHASLRIAAGGSVDPTKATARISSRHFEIHVQGRRAWICDLRSTGGTRLNGQTLNCEICDMLLPRNEIEVAGVLCLVARVVTPAIEPDFEIPGVGFVDATAPAVLVERPENLREEFYGLVPGRLAIGEDLEIVNAMGRLYWRRGGAQRPVAEGVLMGDRLHSGDLEIEVIATGDTAGEG